MNLLRRTSKIRRRKPLLAALLTIPLLATQAAATWSICVINLRTGEMCVASATCVDNSDLMAWTPMIIPGVGIAVCQAASPSEMKVVIQEYMLLGHSPERLSKRVDNKFGNVGARQYAILDMEGRFLVHTGETNGVWAGHLTGQSGDYLYTIQGNVLAGEPVITEAEQAFLTTSGDMSQKVMAAMEAAASMGGDGRCSCSVRFPDSCGTPPPNFSQSATIGYMVIARDGDVMGTCTPSGGCATGDFYMRLNEPFHSEPSTDPVTLLRADYDAWRLAQVDRPDAYESILIADTHQVQPGSSTVNYWLELYDLDGLGISHGGAAITLEHLRGSAELASLHSFIDHGDGTYTIKVQPGNEAGLDEFAFRVDDGVGISTRMWPPQKLLHEPGVVAPLGSSVAVGGLNGVLEIRSAHIMADGLRAWLIADDGAGSGGGGSNGDGMQLMRADRADVDSPFSAPVVTAIENTDSSRVESIWMSDDELRLTLSARNADGLEEIYASTRDTTMDAFSEPKRQGPLASDLGEGSPWLSKNELEIYFSTGATGSSQIFRADRLSPEASWYPPHEITGLNDGHGKGEAMLVNSGTRLMYTDHTTWRTGLRSADLQADGRWALSGLMPGEAVKTVDSVGLSEDGSIVWTLLPAATSGAGPNQLRQSNLAANTLAITPDSISAASGGQLSLTLSAGADWANSTYEILVGNPGSGMMWNGHVLPITPNWLATGLVHFSAGSGIWSDFRGQLDASGNQTAVLDLPAGAITNPSLIGTTLSLTFAADPTGVGFVSNAVMVNILP